ncbi:MAG TPA: cation transporter [Treponema sp.]|nr:cation transporter [Treponema sp.]HCA19087.1 cation transporter [Treponema sp.]
MIDEAQKIKYIRIAGIIALAGNIILAGEKLFFGIYAHSMALLGDGIDSTSDVVIAIVTLVISGIIARPEDKKHPWGHRRAESIATMILSFVIFYCGAQLAITSIQRLASGNIADETSMLAIIASVISIAGKTLLALTQHHYGKKAESTMIKANAENMKSDIMLSSSVLVGLGISRLFKIPVLDPIVALLVGLWVVKNGIMLFLDITMELTDGIDDPSLYERLFNAVTSVPGAKNPHKARIRKLASVYDVDLDFEVDPEMSVYDAHELSEQVEDAIRKEIPEVYDVQIHVEPLGSDEHQPKEGFGVSPKALEHKIG